ncbi:hypothetical protein [Aurantibacter sp.]|uniref:hypothetical protein n=1 Tax=Aurantibacter sp. TaxID=2807103 RepID=UPI00326557A2
MNRFIAILLLICFHVQPAMVISVWVDYGANNDYIKEVLCINKYKPKLECNGKCYLATMLKKESQKKESKEKAIFSEANITPVFFVSYPEVVFNSIDDSTTLENFIYTNHYELLHLSKNDRPPISS